MHKAIHNKDTLHITHYTRTLYIQSVLIIDNVSDTTADAGGESGLHRLSQHAVAVHGPLLLARGPRRHAYAFIAPEPGLSAR